MKSIEWLESRIKVLIPEDIGSQLMFKSNIKKAKEMHKSEKETLYTEEQVNQKMIGFAQWCRTQNKLNDENALIEQLFSEYKSLKQPKQ